MHGRRRSRIIATSVVAGLFMALLVAGAAVTVLTAQPQRWSATSSLLVLPKADDTSPDLVAGLYDALSRGQVPATFAELLRDRSLEAAAADQLRLTDTETQDLSLEVLVVPETSVLDLTVTARSSDVAEAVATQIQQDAESYLSRLNSPYEVVIAGSAEGTARLEGLSLVPMAAVVTVLAAIAGLAVQQAVLALGRARNSRPVESGAATGSVSRAGHSPPAPDAHRSDGHDSAQEAVPETRLRRPR